VTLNAIEQKEMNVTGKIVLYSIDNWQTSNKTRSVGVTGFVQDNAGPAWILPALPNSRFIIIYQEYTPDLL
jgi:hypothetical protein